MNKCEGKVALVTGGSRGIGAAVAMRLAREGADVVLTYERDSESAAGVIDRIRAEGRRGLAIKADSADVAAVTGAVDEAAATFGALDILVNNAGVFLVGPVEDLGRAEFDRSMAVNVRAPFFASQAAARYMGAGGRIVSIGSNVAERTVFPGFSLYAMGKTALVGMTKGLARDLGPRVSPSTSFTRARPIRIPTPPTDPMPT